jgi:integrase
MARQRKLGQSKSNGYTYWSSKIAGKRHLFGRVDLVPFKDAEKAYGAALAAQGEPTPEVTTPAPAPTQDQISLPQIADMYMTHRKTHNDPKANRMVTLHLKRFMEFEGNAHIPASTFKLSHLERYISHVAAVKVKRANKIEVIPSLKTAKKHGVSIKGCFTWAEKNGYLPEGYKPFRAWQGPQLERHNLDRAKLITDGEMVKIREAIATEPEQFRLTIQLFINTGARPDELCRTKSEHFDEANRQIVLTEHKTKGKTGTNRIIKLNDEALKSVIRLLEISRNGKMLPWKDTPCFNKRFRAFIKKHNLRKGLTPYCFRHTLLTNLCNKGIPLNQIAVFGGTSVSMIERIYGHVTSSNLDSIASQI